MRISRTVLAFTLGVSLLWAGIGAAVAVGNDNSSLNNDPGYQKVLVLMKGSRWQEALPILVGLELDLPKSADVHNLLGVTYRKLKDYPRSKVHYVRALDLDPQHLPTLEYQGEWYIETGDIAAAERNLAKIKWICTSCHEYDELAASIQKAKAAAK